jgi:DeoR/GlpR family transcriptional regulator of sugar metabolism
MYVIENSIPEIAQIIKECGEDCGELMIGGEYQKHEEIKSNIPHQQGFRGFDYDEFIEEVRRVDNPRIRIKGMFYSEKKGVENITEAIAFQLESYVKGKGK